MVAGSLLAVSAPFDSLDQSNSSSPIFVVQGCVNLSGTFKISVSGPLVKPGAAFQKKIFDTNCYYGDFSSMEMMSADDACLKADDVQLLVVSSSLMVFGSFTDTCGLSPATSPYPSNVINLLYFSLLLLIGSIFSDV